MRVVQINATYGDGSTGGIVKDIQSQCLRAGIDCYVAYSTASLPKEKIIKGYQIGGLLDHKVHAALCRISGKQGYYSSRATRAFLRWLENLRPDVINIHNLHSNFINFPMLLKWVASHNIALVVTLHDCWCFTGGCCHFFSSNCSRWKDSCGHCPAQYKEVPFLIDSSSRILKDREYLFGQVKKLSVVGVSPWVTKMAQQSIFRNTHCTCIYNGINIDIFKPITSEAAISSIREAYGIKDSYVILGPANKWFEPANKELLNKTLQLGKDFTLVLYGCNTKQLREQIHSASSQTDKTNVVQIGVTSSKETLAQIYNMADVFVNCTHQDTFSLVTAEAQTCGIPVISYANTGVKDIVNTQYDTLVETDDVEGMIEAIKKMKKLAPSQSNRSRLAEWAKSQFDKNINYKDYIDLYNSMVLK